MRSPNSARAASFLPLKRACARTCVSDRLRRFETERAETRYVPASDFVGSGEVVAEELGA